MSGENLLYPTPLILSDDVWKGRMFVANAPAKGIECAIVVKVDNGEPQGECSIILVEYKPDELWTPIIRAEDENGRLAVFFSEVISPSNKGYVATINGKMYHSLQKDDNCLLIDFNYSSLSPNSKIIISGVKYPNLFPSYSFTFTLRKTDLIILSVDGFKSL